MPFGYKNGTDRGNTCIQGERAGWADGKPENLCVSSLCCIPNIKRVLPRNKQNSPK